MLKTIKEFLFNLNPDIIVQAPSRINLINPLDAVEGDYWMPSVAINGITNPLSVFLYIKTINDASRIKIYNIREFSHDYCLEVKYQENLLKEIDIIKKNLNDNLKLFYASIYRFYKTNSYFWERFLKSDFEVGIITTIPRQSGLGGSAALIISILYGFAEYLGLYNNYSLIKEGDFPINKDIIAEMATKVEDEDLKISAGYADRYVISRGGICFCSYKGKLYHKEISQEPLAIYDRIDETYNIRDLPIIICFSGVFHESGDVHRILREKYLKREKKIYENYKKISELSWKSRFALMNRDWKILGKYFEENTKIMNNIMKNAGFKYGIGFVNNILINLIKDHPDIFAVKLTGAGGGGSVFALVNPDKIDDVLTQWKNRLFELIKNKKYFKIKFPEAPTEIYKQLKRAKFFKIKIDKEGVKKL
ncbi:MAG: GHMP family kinase ATP-binding protein [Promethearchaeota archaeon]